MADTTADIPDALIFLRRQHSQATYVDVNPNFKLGTSDLVYNGDAILAAIRNLFRCPIGARGRIFNPEFGSMLYHLLQEPYDDLTAERIEASTYMAIQTWEPRVNVRSVNVVRDDNLPGYRITVFLEIIATGKALNSTFEVPI